MRSSAAPTANRIPSDGILAIPIRFPLIVGNACLSKSIHPRRKKNDDG
jgi:hypothetical protein